VRGFRLLSDEPAHNRYILFVRGQDGRGFGDLVVNHHDLTEEFWGDAAPAIAIRETTACPAIVPLRPDDVRITALADGSTAQGSISGCCCELAATLPRFLRFAVQMTRRLGVSAIAEQKKEITEAAIIEHWPEAQLGPASRSMVGYMATMLRPPEAQRGGAKRAHAA
jgi:hypothetical protein